MKSFPVNAIIVDDETDARLTLRSLLQTFTEVKVVAEARDADEALSAIVQHHPDLIFLDIDMPGKTGLELAHDLRALQLNSIIVFITAFNQHAIEAFEVAAFDYLLKPILPEKLQQTIARFHATQQSHDLNQQLEKLAHQLQNHKIRFNTLDGFTMIDPDEIFFCEADGNYTHIHTTDHERLLVTQQLGKLQEQLDASKFLRVNRSVVVNRKFISTYKRCERQLTITHQLLIESFKVSREVAREL